METEAVRTISKEELLQSLKSGRDVQVLNVLEPKSYYLGSIQGSRRIPLSELDSRFHELDKSKEVITYCASSQCNASTRAAEKLSHLGFSVRAYEGGIKEWKDSGLPTEEIVSDAA